MTTYRFGASMGLRARLSSMKNTCLYSGWSGVIVIFASCWVVTNVGVRTSRKPRAVSASAILHSSDDRSCLLGLAMRSRTPLSLAASAFDIILANCLSRSAASGKSNPEQSSSPYSMRCWIWGSVSPVI